MEGHRVQTGSVVLADSLPKPLYENFMLLSIGVHTLLHTNLHRTHLEYSRGLLVSFIKHFGALYGMDKVSYNVHGLVHLKEDSMRFGALDNVSSVPFESFFWE